MGTGGVLTRRVFLRNVAGVTAAGLALTALPGCVEGVSLGDDSQMAGTVIGDDKYFKMPKAPSAEGLFAPFENGEPFSREWAIAAVVLGHQNQLIVVVIDLETGGQAEFEIYRRERRPKPLAQSRHYNIHLNDGGHGDQETPAHLEQLAGDMAELIGSNEEAVVLDFELSSLKEAERMAVGPHEGPGLRLSR